MQPDFVQPDSAHIPESLIADLVQAATGDRFARYTVVHHDHLVLP